MSMMMIQVMVMMVTTTTMMMMKIVMILAFPGAGNNLDIGAETLEFDIAAVLGRTVSIKQHLKTIQQMRKEKEKMG